MNRETTTPRPCESARQSEILDRALELVRQSGLAGLTTKKLAERVGFTEAALYRHFPSKGKLVLGLMDRLEVMLLDPIRDIAADGSRTVGERLEAILRHHARLVREQNSLPILLLAEASVSEDPDLLGKMRSIFHTYLSLLEGVVREGQVRGELTTALKPDCAALMLLGAPTALAIRHRLLPDPRVEDRFETVEIPLIVQVLSGGAND